jgi:hypothetical protein
MAKVELRGWRKGQKKTPMLIITIALTALITGCGES